MFSLGKHQPSRLPEKYLLVSLPTSSLSQAAAIVSRCAGTFAALVMERDEVSLTVPEQSLADSSVENRLTRRPVPGGYVRSEFGRIWLLRSSGRCLS